MIEPGNIATLLAPFGAPPASIVRLDDQPRPEHLPHLDLRSRSIGAPPLVDAIVEMQHRPVLYVVRGSKTRSEIRVLQHLLAQRGAADHLGILEPGVLTIYSLLQKTPGRKIITGEPGAPTSIPSLAFALDGAQVQSTSLTLHDNLVGLLKSSVDEIASGTGVNPDDALSLIGRALFMRFLIDRRVVSDGDLPSICRGAPSLVTCMETPERIVRTFRWLNRTFNGNLLPLSSRGGPSFWTTVSDPQVVCSELTKILLKTDRHGQTSFDWATLDFSHIPVGLLSEVYEHHSHQFSPERAAQQSVHYTPRAIAEYMVDEAFFGLDRPHRARILDPASGAGVFLVAAFRAIVAAWWRAYGKRPGTQTIRRILYKQLAGFDINEAALRLSALSLYLTALELDPAPKPLSRLRFENLRGRVLFDVRSREDRRREGQGLPVLGSLAPSIPSVHRGAYHVVIGNPPWTSWKRPSEKEADVPGARVRNAERKAAFDQCVHTVERVVQQIKSSPLRADDGLPFTMVDYDPDVPFCWRAMEWAAPKGRIAFALHGRLLFKRSSAGEACRVALFRGARVLGILNAAALRETRVWPDVKAPFCLWFAENRRASSGETFTYASPSVDAGLNRRGHLRIDASDAVPLSAEALEHEPWLLKTLFRGTALDASVMRTLSRPEHLPLAACLKDDGIEPRTGYTVGGKKSVQQSAAHLSDLHGNVGKDDFRPFVIPVDLLKPFTRSTLAFPRPREIYRAPLLLIRESPGKERGQGCVALASEDVAYSESYYGISCYAHPEGKLLARYLLLLLNSDLFLYFALMQSGKFGVERYAVEQQDLERFPLRPLELLDSAARARIMVLSEMVIAGAAPPWNDIHALLASIYGLRRWDMDCIEDALAVSLPYEASLTLAQHHPSAKEVAAFAARLQSQLVPLVRRLGRGLCVVVARALPLEPWIFLEIQTWSLADPSPQAPKSHEVDLSAFIATADGHGTTRIVHVSEPGTLTVGILAQYRYWTLSRARLLALDVMREHEHVLCGREPA